MAPLNELFQAPKRLRAANSGCGANAIAVSLTSHTSIKNQMLEASHHDKAGAQHSPSFICEDNDSQKSTEATAGAQLQLNSQQIMRMEMNKSQARAKRLRKICEERVADAKGYDAKTGARICQQLQEPLHACFLSKGMPFPKLEDLIVEESWLNALPSEFQKPYMEKLSEFVTQESRGSIPIYPPPALVFNALNSCPFDKVKVVIIGQDPYHGPGQAMGLCFSVPNGIKMPSSLVNIFKEIQQDVGCSLPSHGNLERWAVQGVLLLNTVLTVRAHQANSHAKRGWEVFTDAVIRAISLKRSDVIFILWGNSAQEKIRIIDTNKHHILKAAHPSGLSAHRGFFQCRHFSQANKILERLGLMVIDWQI